MKRPAAIQMIDDELFDPVDGRFDSATDTENEPIEPEIDPTTVPVTVPGVDGTEIVTVALRRVDPDARGSVLEVIERLGLFVPVEPDKTTQAVSSVPPGLATNRIPTMTHITQWALGCAAKLVK